MLAAADTCVFAFLGGRISRVGCHVDGHQVTRTNFDLAGRSEQRALSRTVSHCPPPSLSLTRLFAGRKPSTFFEAMDHRLQTQTQNQSHFAPPSSPSPTDDKANYDDLFDRYSTDYTKNPSHQTFNIHSSNLAHASSPQHRRGSSFPLNNQSQSSLSHKPIWDYPPSSPMPAAEKEPSRPFWQKVLFNSSKCKQCLNLTLNADPPRLAVLSVIRTDRGHRDHYRLGNRRRAARALSSGRSWCRRRHCGRIPEDESLPRNFRPCAVSRFPFHKPPGL